MHCGAYKHAHAGSWHVCAQDLVGRAPAQLWVSLVVFQMPDLTFPQSAPLCSHPLGGPGFPTPPKPRSFHSPGCLLLQRKLCPSENSVTCPGPFHPIKDENLPGILASAAPGSGCLALPSYLHLPGSGISHHLVSLAPSPCLSPLSLGLSFSLSTIPVSLAFLACHLGSPHRPPAHPVFTSAPRLLPCLTLSPLPISRALSLTRNFTFSLLHLFSFLNFRSGVFGHKDACNYVKVKKV